MKIYWSYFGLSRNPYSATPDPSFLFLTETYRETLAALLFAVTERKGFMVMTGEAGTGKTTLIRKLLASIPVTDAQFCMIVNPVLTRAELLEAVLMDFGERHIPASKPTRLEVLRRRLVAAQAAGRTSVLVIDEAHLLTEDLMEEVRLLSNFETSEEKLLQIVLAGQSELDRVLSLDSMRQVRQRVAVRMQLNPLEEGDVARYLQSRWACASEQPLPFTEDAIVLMARASRGIPRILNMIADAALVNAFGSDLRLIRKQQIEEVLRDLAIGPTLASAREASRPLESVPLSPAVSPASTVRDVPSFIERYSPAKEKEPRMRKIANWFGFASGDAR